MTPQEIWQIVSSIISVAAVVTGLPSILLWRLGRRDANKKIDLEEGALEVDVFAEQRQAFKDYTAQQTADIAELRREMAELKSDRDHDRVSLGETRRKLERVRRLFLRYVRRVGVQMTLQEQEEFDKTEPTPRSA